jgi:tetratricopeptide (TPR) repeat protein
MPEKPFHLHLQVTGQHSGQYVLTFDSSQYLIMLNPEAVTFNDWLRRLHPVLIGGNDPAEGFGSQEDLLRNVGTWLWQALFPKSAPDRERDALAHALRTGHTPLLFTLPDLLAELPWELLCDPEQSGERGFLARRRPLMRSSPSSTAITPIKPPLRVLLLISSPPSLGENSRVDVESERAAVEQATHQAREEGKLYLRVEDIVTVERVQNALVDFQPHIVHYIGHSVYNAAVGGALLWEDEQGNELPILGLKLTELLCPRNLHAVVLHACQTGRSDARRDVHGVAGTLVKEGIPVILAQQANFTYESSQRASRAWYSALTAKRGFAQALFEVRQVLSLTDRPDWAVPILYGSSASLTPLFEEGTALPGSADPLLKSFGALTDLPTPTGVFVGRHRELRALRLMLENVPGSGPVMALITGPGGVGKSTLAAQAVIRYGKTYKGALTLHCQVYQGIDLFLQNISEFLKRLGMSSFPEQYQPDPKLSREAKIEEAIVTLNAAGPLLLIIDNLESMQNEDQTIRDEAFLHLLQKLLTNLRGGRVFMTGRYALPDLLPQGKFAANLLCLHLDDLSPYETNQLLMRHPTLARLGGPLRNMLLRDFGGLPYVYDLLSSIAAVEDLEQIIYKVRESSTGEYKVTNEERKQQEWQKVDRGVVELATLESIMSQLSEASRTLLTQLSVLRQPFPLAVIEEGLGAERPVWQPLLDWSLLHYDPREQTYRLHSLTKRYAEGLLQEQDQKQTQVRLASWYKHYAIQSSHHLADALEAHHLWRAAGHVQQAGQLVIDLAERLRRLGLYPLLHHLCKETHRDVQQSDKRLTAEVLYQWGATTSLQENYEEAQSLCRQGLEIFAQLGDQSGQANCIHQLGAIAEKQEEYEQAYALYHQCLELLQLGDQEGRATVLHSLGNLAYFQRKYEEARNLYQQSLEICEQLGDQSGWANCIHQLAMIAEKQGEYKQARGLYYQSLEIFVQLGDLRGQAISLHQLATIAQNQGEYQQGQDLCQQSLEICEQLGDQHGRANCIHQLAMIAEKQGEYEEARSLYLRCLETFEQLGNRRGRASVQVQLENLAYLQGKDRVEPESYQQSLETFVRLGDQSGQAGVLHQLGMIARSQGKYEEARNFYQQSLEIWERLGEQHERAKVLHNLGNLAYWQGKDKEAQDSYQQSLEILKQLGDQSGQAVVLHQLGMIAENQKKYKEARGLYHQSLEIKGRLGNQSGRAKTLHQLGNLAYRQWKFEEARDLYRQNLEICERLGDQRGRAKVLYQLGLIAHKIWWSTSKHKVSTSRVWQLKSDWETRAGRQRPCMGWGTLPICRGKTSMP